MPRRRFLLKSTLSNTLFNNFKSAYQSYSLYHEGEPPFVYVDHTGNMKLLTSVVENGEGDDEVFAVSVAEDGWMEFLSF